MPYAQFAGLVLLVHVPQVFKVVLAINQIIFGGFAALCAVAIGCAAYLIHLDKVIFHAR